MLVVKRLPSFPSSTYRLFPSISASFPSSSPFSLFSFSFSSSPMSSDTSSTTTPTYIDYKIDASAGGCSGMYWRTECNMDSTSNRKDWPKNGQILKGYEVEKGWVKFDNGMFMPIEQNGKTVTHKVTK